MDSRRYRVALELLFSSIRGITGHKRCRISGPDRRDSDRKVPKQAGLVGAKDTSPGIGADTRTDKTAHGPRRATGPARVYAYTSAADLHSNCRTIRQTRHYESRSESCDNSWRRLLRHETRCQRVLRDNENGQ